MKLPQVTPPQVAVQSTPRFLLSFVTVADRLVEEPAITIAGGAVDIVTTIGAAVTMLAVTVTVFVGSVVEDTVIVTVPPEGATAEVGAV